MTSRCSRPLSGRPLADVGATIPVGAALATSPTPQATWRLPPTKWSRNRRRRDDPAPRRHADRDAATLGHHDRRRPWSPGKNSRVTSSSVRHRRHRGKPTRPSWMSKCSRTASLRPIATLAAWSKSATRWLHRRRRSKANDTGVTISADHKVKDTHKVAPHAADRPAHIPCQGRAVADSAEGALPPVARPQGRQASPYARKSRRNWA